MNKLSETRNFLKLYMHHVGDSQVPRNFHKWSCLSLIAACVANRVCIEVIRGTPTYPNLYVFLLGPSGCGKGVAIDMALNFLKHPERAERASVYAATKVTAEYLLTNMSVRGEQGKLSTLYLSTPELSLSVGRGDRADSFIRMMTELWNSRDYEVSEGTVGRGKHVLRHYCINWIAGSTEEWLNDSVRRQDIVGGFFARVIPVEGAYAAQRITFPTYPLDYVDVVGYMAEKVDRLLRVEGVFTVTPQALDIHEQWAANHPQPSDPMLAPNWARSNEMVMKLAMLLSLADDGGEDTLLIEPPHMIGAQQLIAEYHKWLPGIIDRASETEETLGFSLVRDLFIRYGQVTHRQLMEFTMKRGLGARRVREYVDTLVQIGHVVRLVGQTGTKYAWVGKGKKG